MNKQAVIDWPTVLKLMGGGAMLGTGIGAGSSLVNYLSNLNAKAKAKQDTSRDDDVLYLDLPSKPLPAVPGVKQAASGSPATFAFGGLGTMLVRGLAKVRAVCLLHALAHNLSRAHSLRLASA